MVSRPLSEGQNIQGYSQTSMVHFKTQFASFTDKNVSVGVMFVSFLLKVGLAQFYLFKTIDTLKAIWVNCV